VFILTHHIRPTIEMDGGTTFHFIDTSPAKALDVARRAAGDEDIRIGGGPSLVREFLASDLIDHLHILLVPIVLGRGAHPWDGLAGIERRVDVETVSSPRDVTHLTFTADSREYARCQLFVCTFRRGSSGRYKQMITEKGRIDGRDDGSRCRGGRAG
jgi:dihydrofolate reductase